MTDKLKPCPKCGLNDWNTTGGGPTLCDYCGYDYYTRTPTPAPQGAPETIRTTIGLLDSMVKCGEAHSFDSQVAVNEALTALDLFDARIATARNEALEEAAEWHEGRAVLCEKEVGKDAKGKQIYSEAAVRHRWFAGSIRALKTEQGE